ncbi:YeaH/YhbH family protein [Ectothiorhodospira lacustris]|uniref:YeaH/YhbH family protein n=1 Tax=Ectothiorhodospira lacustris TaxID=2899127 RepID=UPI001EE86714|nr:YeaH/YhbH family protein [Ectothiorhodospira lacustris]MCG5520956.1 YeaH/YhbH family protein [Ectothiorhodospira lacustris]
MVNIVDRRLNPKDKSLANRQRFIGRARRQILDAVRDVSARRKVADIGQGGEEISIPADGLQEPGFRKGSGKGLRRHVVPGNKQYVAGDAIARPEGGQGQGGRGGSPQGEGEDVFQFTVSRDEFLDLFFENLELPDLVRTQLTKVEHQGLQRAGYSVSGSPSNLNLARTMRNSLSRRLALKRPRREETRVLDEEIDRLERSGKDPERLRALIKLREEQIVRAKRIPYIDPIDLRYNRFDPVPKPISQAVMFCLMDVSGSMTEDMKDLAKRFFMLLYLFLQRRYQHVDIVFIRHTHIAQEVDEDTFFYSRETGGTLVSPALEEMERVLRERYDPTDWNIYAAQASDGDNTPADNPAVVEMMESLILPVCRYFAYIEVAEERGWEMTTDLWQVYERLVKAGRPLAMRKVKSRADIFPVFRDLFTPVELRR